MSSDVQRRLFIRQLIASLGGAALLSSGLTACTTVDEYLFEDHHDLKDQVLIIGGGLSGLQLAYLLKQNKTEFRLFEGSNRFGGRVRSYQNYDLGASLFSPNHIRLRALLKEFSLPAESLNKKNFYLPAGMETLVNHLVTRISGLMAYRNLRLKWKLLGLRKNQNSFELIFDTPKGRRTFLSSRVALAIPPNQWSGITGLLELDEMKEAREWLKALKPENIIKAIVPLTGQPRIANLKSILTYEDSLFEARQVNKRTKSATWAEVDFSLNDLGPSLEIQKLNEFMKRKMNLLVNYSKLGTENYFDWQETKLIGAASFKNALPWPEMERLNFQVIGDFTSPSHPNTMEGALDSAFLASKKLI